jgi:hypothetical protein
MCKKKKLNCLNRKINITITRIPNAYRDPNILAEFIVGQLKNIISFRKAIKKAIRQHLWFFSGFWSFHVMFLYCDCVPLSSLC